MRYFPLLFTSIVIGLHIYLFFNLRRAFGGGLWQVAAGLGIAFGMYLVYFRGRDASPLVHQATYMWIGFLIITGEVFLFRELFAVLSRVRDWAFSGNWFRFFSSPEFFRITLVLALIAYGWALYEASRPIIKEVRIGTDRLPAGTTGVRVALLTDIHITPWTRAGTVREIVDMTNSLDADIVVLAGDFVDGQFAPDSWQAVELQRLTHRQGKVAVLGNHELYSGRESSIRFIQGAGFTLLRGDAVPAGPIVIAGVDDPQVDGRVEISEALDAAAALNPDAYRLLVTHRPEAPDEAVGRFDLAVSGHTHGGQVWPFRYIIWYLSGFPQGLTVLPSPSGRERAESRMYVSNGTRFWGPPVRLFTPAEITLFAIEPVSR